MAIELSLVIGGMCILVSDATRQRVHVIAPRCNHHPHTTRIFAEQGTGWSHDLDDGILDLSRVADNSGTALDIPEHVLSVVAVTGQQLVMPYDFLSGEVRDHRVGAHIVLSGGDFTPAALRCFRARPDTPAIRETPTALIWTAIVNDETLPEFPIKGLRNNAERRTSPLRAVDGRLRIGLATTLPYEFPDYPDDLRNPDLDFEAEHFGCVLVFWPGASGTPERCHDHGPLSTSKAPPAYPRICPLVVVDAET